jgi:hypothetical protein
MESLTKAQERTPMHQTHNSFMHTNYSPGHQFFPQLAQASSSATHGQRGGMISGRGHHNKGGAADANGFAVPRSGAGHHYGRSHGGMVGRPPTFHIRREAGMPLQHHARSGAAASGEDYGQDEIAHQASGSGSGGHQPSGAYSQQKIDDP